MKNLLLPYKFKLTSLILITVSFALTVAYFWFNFQLRIPVFAVLSSFIETRMFVTFQTNFADELILILLLSGILLLVFTREKNEELIPEYIRLKALMYALLVNSGVLLFSAMFVYGSGFVAVLVFNFISLPVFYLIVFYILKRKLNG